MYFIRILDKEDHIQEVLKSKSQMGIDVITSSFEDRKNFLDALKLNSNFKVKIYKYTDKKEGLVELPYCDNRYREFLSIVDNNDEKDNFFEKVSKFNKKALYDYFLDEKLKRYKYVTSEFDIKKKDKLEEIIKVLQDNSINKEDFSSILCEKLKEYYYNKNNKNNNKNDNNKDAYENDLLYDNAKHLYGYLMDLGLIKPEYRELTDKEKMERTPIINGMRAQVYDAEIIDSEGKPVSFRSTYLTNHSVLTDPEKIDSREDDLIDIGKKYADSGADEDFIREELYSHMVSMGMDEDQQRDFLSKNGGKIFK